MRLNQKSIKSMKHFTRALFKCLLETRFIPCIHIEITRRKVLLNRMASNDCCTTVWDFSSSLLKTPSFYFVSFRVFTKTERKENKRKYILKFASSKSPKFPPLPRLLLIQFTISLRNIPRKKIFKPVRNVYTYEQRLESLKRIRSARRGGGADRSARGRLKRSKFGKRGLHPTTGCQWRGIGSKGHATMRPRSKEKLAVSTRGGGFAIGLHPFGLLAVCSRSWSLLSTVGGEIIEKGSRSTSSFVSLRTMMLIWNRVK